jgi:hypothetical protein
MATVVNRLFTARAGTTQRSGAHPLWRRKHIALGALEVARADRDAREALVHADDDRAHAVADGKDVGDALDALPRDVRDVQ